MILIFLLGCIVTLLTYWCFKIISDKEDGFVYLLMCPQTKTVDGSKLRDVVHVSKDDSMWKNTFDLVGMNPEKLFYYARTEASNAKRSYLLHFLFTSSFNVIKAKDLEDILKNHDLITKGVYYIFLHEFLGTGLLTSDGKKWQFRRKLLTPSFHFNILEEFLEVFRSESQKFVKDLENLENQTVCLQKIVPKSTLNMISETALGIKLDEMTSADDYRNTIKTIEHLNIERASNFFMYFELFFYYFGKYNETIKHCGEAHRFTSGIVNQRRSGFQVKETVKNGKKQRFALLDNLLMHEKDGQIDHQGICEEVDTLTFEGYDTTSTGIMFTLLMLATHEKVQQKVYEEILENTKDDPNSMTLLDYSNFKYLECVIKESLRLYPPVPYISRKVLKDTVVGNLILKKNMEISIHIFDIHRDPEYFPDPEKFDPERFTPENSKDRHPFAFIPFSAGLRNCIGQRFAMLELKIIIAAILRKYKIMPITRREELTFQAGLILRSAIDINVKFQPR